MNPTSLLASHELDEVDVKVACIQTLIPVALAVVEKALTAELTHFG